MKNIIRQNILKQRHGLSKTQLEDYNQQFYHKFIAFFETYYIQYKPKIIGGYYAIHNEFDIRNILNYCRSIGLKTALPICHGKDKLLSFHLFDGNYNMLEKDAYEIPAPSSNSSPIIPDLIICPAVAMCQKSHKRLGYGGGFFDRYAAQHPNIHFVGGFAQYQYIDNPDIFTNHDLIFYKYFIL